MGVKTFYIEPTGDVLLYLYVYSHGMGCPFTNGSFHRTTQLIEERMKVSEDGTIALLPVELEKQIKEKYQWPTHCACHYEFADQDIKTILREAEYQTADGRKMTLEDAPAGAMWNVHWYNDMPEYTGPDGLSLVAKTPDGYTWTIDGRASNCDSPCVVCTIPYHQHPINDTAGHYYKDAKPHKCWIRHGDPKSGNIHVDKNGTTCGAGAGSIQTPSYHGFLHNGSFT